MLGMMWLGSHYGEPAQPPARMAPVDEDRSQPLAWSAAAAAAVIAVVAAPIALARMSSGAGAAEPMRIALPPNLGSWSQASGSDNPWHPGLVAGDATAAAAYDVDGQRVDAVVLRTIRSAPRAIVLAASRRPARSLPCRR
jgi:hypothetical protein